MLKTGDKYRHPQSSKSLKILLVQESDWLLRGPHQQHHIMEKLSIKGHVIHVIDYPITWRSEKIPGLYSKREVFEDVSRFYKGSKVTVIRPSIIKLPIFDKISICFTHRREIKKEMADFNPDVVVGLGILNNYFAIREARKANVAFIYYLIDTLHRLVENKLYSLVAKQFERNNIQNSDYILTINKQLKEYVKEMGGEKENISIIPAGIDLSMFQNNDLDRASLREKYKIKEDDFIIFFMGWLYSFSGILELAEKIVKENHPGIKMMVVGEGDIYPSLIDLVNKSKTDKIILTGKRPYSEIPGLLSIADTCVLPSHNNEIMKDIVPIKIYEYLASGKPVICSKLEGIFAEFGSGSGILYSNTINDLYELIIKLKNDERLREALSQKALMTVKNQDWEKIIQSFETFIFTAHKENTLHHTQELHAAE